MTEPGPPTLAAYDAVVEQPDDGWGRNFYRDGRIMIALPTRAIGPGPSGDGYCCGAPVHVAGPIRYRTADCTTQDGQPIRTVSRWVLIKQWQCHLTREHGGEWWSTSDDPA